MPARRKRKLTPPVPYPQDNPEDEEVFSVHTVSDTSPPPAIKKRALDGLTIVQPVSSANVNQRNGLRANGLRTRSQQKRVSGKNRERKWEAVSIMSISDGEEAEGEEGEEEEDIKLVEVDIAPKVHDEDLELDLEEVDVPTQAAAEDETHAYVAAYKAISNTEQVAENGAAIEQPIFKDGKGQPGGISVSLASTARKPALGTKTNVITGIDRQTRLAVHKWMVLCLIAHAKIRNKMINNEGLRDQLYALVPNQYLEKLRAIHPKKVPNQSERVRQFETLLRDLTRWWSFKFHLEPNLTTGAALRQPDPDLLKSRIGKRVDGWIIETAKEKEERHKKERKEQQAKIQENSSSKLRGRKGKGKGKMKEQSPEPTEQSNGLTSKKAFLSEITLFGTGNSTTPIFLRLAEAVERIEGVQDLQNQVIAMCGSRETKAQLFASLCRALGIPSRLVISLQAPSWSVAASKVAATTGATVPMEKFTKLLKQKRTMQKAQRNRRNIAHRREEVATSDDEGFTSAISTALSESEDNRGRSMAKRSNGTTSRPLSVASTATIRSAASASAQVTPKRGNEDDHSEYEEEDENKLKKKSLRSNTKANGKVKGIRKGNGNGLENLEGKGKAKSKAKADEKEETDYRDEKWKNAEGPLEVKFEPKLRIAKPKGPKPGEIAPQDLDDIVPVDVSAPPTMWVEVFSKPWQKWITVDPVRGMVEPMGNRQMEPSPTDKSNRLVYVVAFEEDGYARDVTPRYTKTLHSRVSRMRPPQVKEGGEMIDWWGKVVKSFHRPQKLERDAIEDVELEGAAAKEPMPSSVAAFKEHPVYTLEKHLKRDEVIFPAKQAGTFQGIAVFLKANVVSCRSARQWYNQGRVIKDGEEALKWVKSRGYTIANKRAEEEARQQGQDGLQEGLYASFQTELYQPPPVLEGIIPTNSFGNIDLFVDTMLPEGARHVPYSGAVRVAKKMGISYAEAITGFEFRKHRSMPKMTGVVVAAENEAILISALEEDQQMSAEKEFLKRQERLFKNWKKLLNSLKIQERIQREYGQNEEMININDQEDAEADGLDTMDENLEAYANVDLASEEEEMLEGGFVVD